MANVRDSDTSLWLHNKLGTSNDSWISGSICSQLNKEVLRNIKECFPDLQTQVKLKLLLSFFHIPRRLVEEWKTELEEVIEVAGLDSELWVSMLAETMKTFPATSSLNTEISDYEDTRPIFTDMVNDLRKLVSKHSDLGMLPLECQYLNKNALVSVVGQQQNPVKHFTLKRKPKSANLRTELLHKSADAQSSLKKASAPTIPLRSRGMPRKMTDTTPLKGIPSRVPTSGFRSPNVPANQQRPNLSRTPAGRKDGGIKLIEFTEQPLGYAAAKKRKREQQLEEQQKKQEQKQQNAAAAAAAAAGTGNTSPTTSPLQTNSGAGSVAGAPTTPISSVTASFEIKTETSATSLLNQSLEEGNVTEVKDVVSGGVITAKSEPITPDYAPALTYTTLPVTPAVMNVINTSNTTNLEDSKSHSKTVISMSNAGTAAAAAITTSTIPKVTSISVQTQPSNNNMNHKRIKQEIEIKSEEILVPPTIKVEKIDTLAQQDATTQILLQQKQQVQQQQQTTQISRLQQQRVIIQQQQIPQQQQQTQHVLIRTAPQQQKQTIIGGMTTLTTTSAAAAAARQKINAINTAPGTTIKMEKLDIKPLVKSTPANTLLTQQQLRQGVANPLANLPNNISVKITSTKATKVAQQQQQQQQQQPIMINSSTPVILASSPAAQSIRQKQMVSNVNTTTAQTLKSLPLSQLKSATNSGPVIISQTIIQPAKRAAATGTSGATSNVISSHQQQQQQPAAQQHQQQQPTTQYILTSSAPQQQQHQQSTSMPTLTSFTQASRAATTVGQQTTTLYQTAGGTTITGSTPNSTKILLKTSSSSGGVMMTPMRQQHQTSSGLSVVSSGNPPPLIATSTSAGTQQPTILNIQNVQLPNRPVTIQPASQAAQQQHLQAQLQQQQPQQHTIVSNTTATQQPKLTQVLVQSNPSTIGGVNVNAANAGVKNKTIYLTQKGVILRNIGGDMYQQIPISNVSGLQTLGAGTTTLMTTSAGPPGLVKTTQSNMVQQPQTIQLQTQQQQHQPNKQHLPTLIPNTMTPQHMIVHQHPAQTNLLGNNTQQTIIRPVMSGLQAGLTTLPQGLTLIQRPGQQPQLVQVQTAPAAPQQQTQIQRTIITQQPAQQQQLRSQQIVLQHKQGGQQRIITTAGTNVAAAAGGQQIQITQNNPSISRIVQVSQQPQQQQTATQQAPQRKGLSLSNEHVHKAHEMFRKANRVSRPDKALILGFMAGLRENPRPNSENVIVIKLGETEEKVQQEDSSTALCLVESLIRLDYNTGEWKTFQNYRRLDQSAQGQQATDAGMQTQNSVVI